MTTDMGPVISAVQAYGDEREQVARDELQPQIDSLTQQLADCRASQPTPTPTPTPTTLVVGARAKDTTNAVMQSTIGPVKAERWFSPGTGSLPAKFTRSYNSDAIPDGVDVWASYNDATEANLRSYVKSADPGTKMVLHHEPEGDFPSGAAYVKWFDAQAAIIHDASKLPTVHAAAAYEYRKGGLGVDGSWVPDSADIYTIDTYRRTLADMVPLEQDDRFQTWLALVQPKGKPIGITEYGRGLIGQGAATDAKRAELIAIDGDYLRKLGAVVWMYWWTSGGAGDWRFTDKASVDAWRAQAAK